MPDPPGLLEALDTLQKALDEVLALITWRGSHINLPVDLAMQIGCRDIELLELVVESRSDREEIAKVSKRMTGPYK